MLIAAAIALILTPARDASACPRLRHRSRVCLYRTQTAVKNALPGYDSPERAFRAYLTGAVTEDFDQMLSALTPESRAYHVGLAMMSVGYLFDKAAGEKLLRDHGADFFLHGHAPATSTEAGRKNEPENEALVRVVLTIKNPGQLMKAIVVREEEIARQWAKTGEPHDTRKQPTTEQLIGSVVLNDVKINGSAASADIELTQPAKDYVAAEWKTVKFRQIRDRWYCDIDPR
jgi:hypothetical protein